MTPLLELGSALRDLADERGINPFHAGALIAATAIATIVTATVPAPSAQATAVSQAQPPSREACVVRQRRACATSFANLPGARR